MARQETGHFQTHPFHRRRGESLLLPCQICSLTQTAEQGKLPEHASRLQDSDIEPSAAVAHFRQVQLEDQEDETQHFTVGCPRFRIARGCPCCTHTFTLAGQLMQTWLFSMRATK